MGDSKRTTLDFRISTRHRSVAEISAILCAEPTDSADRGTPYSARTPASPLRDASVWLMGSQLPAESVPEEHFRSLLDFLRAKREALDVLRGDCEMDICCGFASETGQGGFVLAHEMLMEIGQLGLDIEIDLYPAD